MKVISKLSLYKARWRYWCKEQIFKDGKHHWSYSSTRIY